jgi:flavin-dependent dehydrogenase
MTRLEFDNQLLKAAIAAGAVDLTGHEFVNTDLTDSGRSLHVREKGSGDRTIQATFVVGADGAYSTVRRALGVPTAGPNGSGVAMRAYAECYDFDEGADIGPRLLIDYSQDLYPGYGWVFPDGRGRVNVGVGVSVRDLQRRGLRLHDLLDKYVRLNRDRGLGLGEVKGRRSHQLPHIGSMPALVHPRAVLIGDAGSMLNPISGEGIFYGVKAASLLAEHIISVDAVDAQHQLHSFERHFKREFRAHFASIALAYKLMRSPRWTSVVLRAAARDNVVLMDAIDLLFGAGRLKASTTGRILLKGLLARRSS